MKYRCFLRGTSVGSFALELVFWLQNYSAVNDYNGRLNLNGNYNGSNRNGFSSGIALSLRPNNMENEEIYQRIYSLDNLVLAWREARKGKTKKKYVIEFEKNTMKNLLELQREIKEQTYFPMPLQTFILRDPKTRKISKSDFRDRIVHHALIRVIQDYFGKGFIYDSCANIIGKGNLFALKRFDKFKRKITNNLRMSAFCLKADIKHYFDEVDHKILIKIISRKIKDDKVINLIRKILKNDVENKNCERGMPLGNLTSQFFANVYLHELDYFVKHHLKARYYIRYVDDFVILNKEKKILEKWKLEIDYFLRDFLNIELHQEKSRVLPLDRCVDFVGFRNYWHHRLLRKRSIGKMLERVRIYKRGAVNKKEILESFQGWNGYVTWANSYRLRRKVVRRIYCDHQT